MSVWFTSDLHLGHAMIAQTRNIASIGEHDNHIIETINETVAKRAKLFILGDLAFSSGGLKKAGEIRCQNVELIMGNHDKYPIHKYVDLGWKIHGFRGYRNFWLSHCPIHPNEMRQKIANIHGHIHIFGDTGRIDDPRYFCVNPEFHNMKPVSLNEIMDMTA